MILDLALEEDYAKQKEMLKKRYESFVKVYPDNEYTGRIKIHLANIYKKEAKDVDVLADDFRV